MASAFAKLQTPDPVLTRIQQNVGLAINPLLSGPPWVPLPLFSPWVSYNSTTTVAGAFYGGPAYSVDVNGVVRLRGLLAAPSITLPSTVAQLPTTAWPASQTLLMAPGVWAGVNVPFRVDVPANGQIAVVAAFSVTASPQAITYISLDGISFIANNT